MTPIPYLFFKGTAEEAIRFYARVLGAPEPQIVYARDTPEGETSGLADAVMHAALQVGDGWLYASDYSKAEPMTGSSIALTFPTVDESRRIFDTLSEGGQVEMPLAATFWSPGFGAFTDRFGTRWMIDTLGAEVPEGASSAPAEAGAA